jgi:hypothetical protein
MRTAAIAFVVLSDLVGTDRSGRRHTRPRRTGANATTGRTEVHADGRLAVPAFAVPAMRMAVGERPVDSTRSRPAQPLVDPQHASRSVALNMTSLAATMFDDQSPRYRPRAASG